MHCFPNIFSDIQSSKDSTSPMSETCKIRGATKQRQEKTGEDRKKSMGGGGVESASGDRLGLYLAYIQVSLNFITI